MKNSRKLDSPKRSIIDKKKKRLVNSDPHDNENSDVLVSAVISPYLLTHLHHILQQSEYYAQKDGRKSHAANFAKLRKGFMFRCKKYGRCISKRNKRCR